MRGAELSLMLRVAFPDDAEAIARVAALDSAEPPSSPAQLLRTRARQLGR